MHSTNDLEDGYIGSGQRLWHSIKKYGRENFVKEILEYFPDRESLQNKEIEIVNSDLLLDPLCMNISLGGRGTKYGSTFPNRKSSPLSESHKTNISKSCEGKAGKYQKSEEHRQKLAKANLGKIQDDVEKEKRAESLKKFWRSPDSESAKQSKSESLKEAWKLRREKPRKKNKPYSKPLSMSPGAIKIREQREKLKLKK